MVLNRPAPYFFAFSMADLAVTIIGVYGIGLPEANPIAKNLISYPFLLFAYKVIGTVLVCWIMTAKKKFDTISWVMTFIMGMAVLTNLLIILGEFL